MASETIWKVCDNSGIKTAKQLKIKFTKCNVAKPGDLLTVFPRKFRYIKVIQRQKYIGLVTVIKRKLKRYTGTCIKGSYNGIVILNDKKKFLGSRVFGPLYREVRYRRSSYVYKRIFARTAYFI